jgi:hypothetical protein
MEPQAVAFAIAGVIFGLVLLVRGFGGYRSAAAIADTAPSRIASAAVGEILISGVVEPAELTLISPLQSAPCVFYRARIDQSDGETASGGYHEERSVGFRVRDETGDLRVFPRDARFDVPNRFDEHSGAFGDEPSGLQLRAGPAFAQSLDRDAQIAALLTVHPAGGGMPSGSGGPAAWSAGLLSGMSGLPVRGHSRRYCEARIEPGEVVTILGQAMPFDQLPDPASADVAGGGDPLGGDPEVAADLAAARASGILESDPAEAWGNAAIPGFGIGRPVREPELDEAANEPALAGPGDEARYERSFEIAPDALILAAGPDSPLVISFGAPAEAAGRHQREFLIGLLGAIVAIGSAMALAIMAAGGIDR